MEVRDVSSIEMTPERFRVHQAGVALHRDGATPAGALELLAAIAEDRTWEKVLDQHGKSFVGRFRVFVTTKAPFGLGVDLDQLEKVLELRHPKEVIPAHKARFDAMRREVRTLLKQEIPPAAQHGTNQHTEDGGVRATNSSHSDRAETIVRRLKRDAPELAARVIAGEVTPNAAARQMGWRRPRVVVSSPESVAAALRRHMCPGELQRLCQLLGEDD